MKIRADEPVSEDPVVSVPVATPGAGPPQGALARPERGPSAVVLEPGERREPVGRLDDDLTDETGRPGAGHSIDETEPVDGFTVGRVIAVADELEARAHGEDRRSV